MDSQIDALDVSVRCIYVYIKVSVFGAQSNVIKKRRPRSEECSYSRSLRSKYITSIVLYIFLNSSV